MKKIMTVLISGALVAGLGGCAQPGQPGITGQQGGTVIGAVAGGIIGSQFGAGAGQVAATIGGTLLGGFIGNRVGAYFDQQSQIAANQAAQSAMQTGSVQTWHTAHSSGRVVPRKAYRTARGHVCRPFTTTVTMQGRTQVVHGTACKNSRGQWVAR